MRIRRLILGLFVVLSLPTIAAAKTIVWTCPLPIYMSAGVDVQTPLPANVYIMEHRYSGKRGKYAPAATPPTSNQTISVGNPNPVVSFGGN